MQTPWFFATTPPPRPAVPEVRRPVTHRSLLARVIERYAAWGQRSHERLRGYHV